MSFGGLGAKGSGHDSDREFANHVIECTSLARIRSPSVVSDI